MHPKQKMTENHGPFSQVWYIKDHNKNMNLQIFLKCIYYFLFVCLVWTLIHLFMLPFIEFKRETAIDTVSFSHSLYIEGWSSIKIDK